MRPLLVSVGVLGGLIASVITRAAAESQVVIGQYPLGGEGAFVLPPLLVPLVIFAGWSAALLRGGRPLDLVLYAAGVHVGIGLISLDPVLILLGGLLLVDGSAAISGIGLFWGRRVDAKTMVITLGIATAAAFLLVFAYFIVLALAAGVAAAYTERHPSRIALAAGLLVLLTLTLALVPITAARAT
jgi:hypothetical protein